MDQAALQNTLTFNDLTRYFADGCKIIPQFKIGVEWEKIGVYRQSGKAISYSGERGVEAIFKQLIGRYSWQPVLQNGHIIALTKGQSSISLEPGGQIELSGRPYIFLKDNQKELYCHLNELKEVSEPLGIVWLGLGMQPMSTLEEIEWTPKERYKIMRQALSQTGSMTHSMMKQTASIQVSIDYQSETDACRKFALAIKLAPVLAALFSNSPVSEGGLNGFYSKRYEIWRHTAPERTGLVRAAFKKNFSFKDYAEYALNVPLLFIQREGRWITPDKPMSFADFMADGLQGFRAGIQDWDLHLTTLFTDARLKKLIEIRSIDCQKKEMGLSVPALIKGIFYDEEAMRQASLIMGQASYEDLQHLRDEVPKKGLNAILNGRPVRPIAVRLIELASQGLDRLVSIHLSDENEVKFLEPIKNCVQTMGKMPAEILMDCFKTAVSDEEKIERILRCSAL